MGKNDIRVKEWLSDTARFADLFNAGVFSGRQVIQANSLHPQGTVSEMVIRDKDGEEIGIQKYRDLIQMVEENQKNKRLHSDAEFLSGIRREDKFLPILHVIFYYGDEE